MRRGFVAMLALAACGGRHDAPQVTPELLSEPVEVGGAGTPPLPPAPALAPLDGHDWAEDIVVGGKKIGVVSVPNGTREPRPIMIALHGGGDRPEWSCGEWRGVTTAYPFIVCPHGPGGKNEFYWSTPALTKKEIDEVVAETKARFGVYVKDGPMVLAGFSLGATQASLLAKQMPETFPRVVIAEGAYDVAPDPSTASGFAKHGQRALFLCTTAGVCEPRYRVAATWFQKKGVPARVNLAGNLGHGMPEAAVASARRDWPWMVEGMEGWETFTPYVEPKPVGGKTVDFAP